MTKRAEKPYPLGSHIPICPYKRLPLYDSVMLELTAYAAFGKQNLKQNMLVQARVKLPLRKFVKGF